MSTLDRFLRAVSLAETTRETTHASALRQRTQRLEAKIARVLARQRRYALDRLRAPLREAITLPPAGDLVPEAADGWLRGPLNQAYRAVLGSARALVAGLLGVKVVLPTTTVDDYLRVAGRDITNINETTRRAVTDALRTGVALGETRPQLAARLETLPEFDRARAQMIAGTEVARAENLSVLAVVEVSGRDVTIRITDGDGDPACAALNGQEVSFAQAQAIPALGHPNCRRKMVPVPRSGQE